MRVKISKLRDIANNLFQHFEATGLDEISLSRDYYWWIPKEAIYDPYNQPESMSLGQLSDDLLELEKIGTGEQTPIPYALVWLSTLLRAIGEETTPQ
jgi:hypothetical protein